MGAASLPPVGRTLWVLRLLRGDVGDGIPRVVNTDEQQQQRRRADHHEALRRIAAQKWTTVGVPKAPTSGPIERASAPSTTTTNCRPVSAAADEPMIT